MEAMATKKIPCVVVSRNLAPTPKMIDVLEKYGVPLFRTSLSSKAYNRSYNVVEKALPVQVVMELCLIFGGLEHLSVEIVVLVKVRLHWL